MAHSSSPICNFIFSLNIYLSLPTRLLLVTWDYNRHHLITGLYYLRHTNMRLNLLTVDQPGFEHGPLGPKVATLPLCNTTMTAILKFTFKETLQTIYIYGTLDQILGNIFFPEH